MSDGFDVAAAITFAQEGGHNPSDEGSDTWYGIRRANHPDETPWPPTKERALEIAREQYWAPYRFDLLPASLACAAFDWVFNGGPAISTLQRILGVTEDGRIGPDTAHAAARANQADTLTRYFARRAFYLVGLHSWTLHSEAWMCRLFSVYGECRRLV
jgi:lysozyme family protein